MTPRSAALLALVAALASLGGCGGDTSTATVEAPLETHPPMEYGFPVIHPDSSYKAMKYLDQSIPLYYPCETAPESYTFLVRGTERGRSGDCESASIKALMALQQSAAKMGANAIINMSASWEGASMMSTSGLTYHCKSGFGGHATGVDWSGDFVIVKPQSGGPISIKPIEQPAEPPEALPGAEGDAEK